MAGRSIRNADIARVRSATDIVALIGGHTQIKRVGKQWMARCPLHGERTPSLSVSMEKGVYYCFGCQRSGDAITFVREIENLDFVEAVEKLADRAGITLQYTHSEDEALYKRKRVILEAVSKARDFYHRYLLNSPDAGPARAYLRSRGYSGDIVRSYRLGWAPASKNRNLLARHLNLAASDLRATGLAAGEGRGAQRDFFYKRLLFPICDENGNPIAFGGRLLPGDNGPKYINTSSAAVLYNKSKVLYGLNEHRTEIVRKGQAVICEGYTDVIGSAMAGINNAVATCGTALTEQHVKLLKRFSAVQLVLAFDADSAGIVAAERVYDWEKKHGLEVLIVDLPQGSDPDDLARSDPEMLRSAVDNAVPFLRFRVDRVLARHHMTTVENRARAATEAASVINEHPDAMVRDRYLMDIADSCRVDIKRLRSQAADLAHRERSTERVATDDFQRTGFDAQTSGGVVGELTPEDEVLRIVIHRPQEIISRLHPWMFEDETRKEIFDVLQKTDSVVDAADLLSEQATKLLHYLAVDPGDVSVSDAISGLVRLAVLRCITEMRHDMNHPESASLRREYVGCIRWLKEQTELLAEPNTRDEALDVLIPWLIEYGTSR